MNLSLLFKFTRFFIYFLFLSDEGPMLETLDHTIRIGSTPTFLYLFYYITGQRDYRILRIYEEMCCKLQKRCYTFWTKGSRLQVQSSSNFYFLIKVQIYFTFFRKGVARAATRKIYVASCILLQEKLH